jgi:hypothetical protein
MHARERGVSHARWGLGSVRLCVCGRPLPMEITMKGSMSQPVRITVYGQKKLDAS